MKNYFKLKYTTVLDEKEGYSEDDIISLNHLVTNKHVSLFIDNKGNIFYDSQLIPLNQYTVHCLVQQNVPLPLKFTVITSSKLEAFKHLKSHLDSCNLSKYSIIKIEQKLNDYLHLL